MLKTAKWVVTSTCTEDLSPSYSFVSSTQELMRVGRWPLMGDPRKPMPNIYSLFFKTKSLGTKVL